MVKPDVILTNPYSLDYPYTRNLLSNNVELFGKIINVLYNDHRRLNLSEYLKREMPYALTIDVGELPGGVDWRNYCVNSGLSKSTATHVLFLEQDFVFTHGNSLLEKILSLVGDSVVAGFADGDVWEVGTRLHPAFLLVDRVLINKTGKDFSAFPTRGLDHFGLFTDDLRKISDSGKLVKFLDLKNYKGWKHYAGVSSNFMLAMEGKDPNYKPLEFLDYVKLNLKAPVSKPREFMELANECLRRLAPWGPFLFT